jgi:hypothetical protein
MLEEAMELAHKQLPFDALSVEVCHGLHCIVSQL